LTKPMSRYENTQWHLFNENLKNFFNLRSSLFSLFDLSGSFGMDPNVSVVFSCKLTSTTNLTFFVVKKELQFLLSTRVIDFRCFGQSKISSPRCLRKKILQASIRYNKNDPFMLYEFWRVDAKSIYIFFIRFSVSVSHARASLTQSYTHPPTHRKLKQVQRWQKLKHVVLYILLYNKVNQSGRAV
jgi:hypothetical protein